jgi:hypothetical protein
MKGNYEKIELLEPIQLDKSIVIILRLEINELVSLTPLIYRSQNPNISKLVLLWELQLDTKINPRQILLCKAQQEILVKLEDDKEKDRKDLSNIIATSHLHLETIIQRHDKMLETYIPLYFNPEPRLDEILRLLQLPRQEEQK